MRLGRHPPSAPQRSPGRAVATGTAAAAITDLERQALGTTTSAQRAGFHSVIDALTEASR